MSSKINKNVLSSEYCEVYSAEVTLKDGWQEVVQKYRNLIDTNILSITIYDTDILEDIKLFDSTIDDDTKSELNSLNSEYNYYRDFFVKIYNHNTYLVSYNRYDSSIYFEIELN